MRADLAPYSIHHAWYRRQLERHGVNPDPVSWAQQDGSDLLTKIILDVIAPSFQRLPRPSILDFGCGVCGLVEYVERQTGRPIEASFDYHGSDLSQAHIDAAKARYPQLADHLFCEDILREPYFDEEPVPRIYDYAVANGTFCLRAGIDKDIMWDFVRESVSKLFSWTREGVAFNVWSGHVDFETASWFHVDFNTMTDFAKTLTKRFVYRNDYEDWAYTVYLYH